MGVRNWLQWHGVTVFVLLFFVFVFVFVFFASFKPQIACEYSRLSSLPAPEGRLAKRPSGAGSDERRLYSQGKPQMAE